MSKVVFCFTAKQAAALLAIRAGNAKSLVPIRTGERFVDDEERGKALLEGALYRRGFIDAECYPYKLTRLGKAAAAVAELLPAPLRE